MIHSHSKTSETAVLHLNTEQPTHEPLARTWWVVLAMIVIVAAVFRLLYLGRDLPTVYDMDEPLFVRDSMAMLSHHTLDPDWFGVPASTTMYLLGLVCAAIFAVGSVFGVFHGAEDFRRIYQTNPTLFYMAGRLISVAAGCSSVWLVYKITASICSRRAGLAAAFALAVSPLHIELSRNLRIDALMTFFVLVSLWFALRIPSSDNVWNYVKSGALFGCAVMTKYPAIVFAFAGVMAHLFSAQRKKIILLCIFGASILAAAFVVGPFAFIRFSKTLHDVLYEARPTHLSATGQGWWHNMAQYFVSAVTSADVSITALLIGLTGALLPPLKKPSPAIVILAAVSLLFCSFISALHLWWHRWLLPVIPLLLMLIAIAWSRLTDQFLKVIPQRLLVYVTSVLLLLVALWPSMKATAEELNQARAPFSATLAKDWIMQNIPPGSRIFVETYGPQLPYQRYALFGVEDGKVFYREAPDGYLTNVPSARLGDVTLDDLRTSRVQYVVLTDWEERFALESRAYAVPLSVYHALENSSTPVRDFTSPRGPQVRILRLY